MQTENYSRSLAAAFRVKGQGNVLVQAESLADTARLDIWSFWIETFNPASANPTRYMMMQAGGEFMDREPLAEEWHKTPTISRWLARVTEFGGSIEEPAAPALAPVALTFDMVSCS